jgi:sterol desaturase/sphingolipid hydroxylase (fatty acid hydroxylase superfamily)
MGGGEIRAAIPFFFALIFVEWLAGGARLYRLNDSIADLGAGIGQQVFAIPLNALLIWIYAWVFKTTALAKWPASSAWSWIAALILVDFAYYWFHRTSHRVNFVWATHIVHHQSEEYNLTVALRQSWIQGLFSMVFYLPLATLGIPLQVALGAIVLNTIGQFWFHTRAIGRMGWLELVLNTPSHHRVHHGRNPKYLDKNYAGVLIVWDRLFGTFVREEEEPVYGVVKPLNSWNVLWANIHQWIELARFCAASKNWKEKMLVWFLPPEQLSGPAPAVNRGNIVKFDARGTHLGQIYATFIFLTALAGLFILNAHLSIWSTLEQAAAGALLIWALASAGAFLEGKRWAKLAEVARLVCVIAFISQVW